jgi:hypothetical protein
MAPERRTKIVLGLVLGLLAVVAIVRLRPTATGGAVVTPDSKNVSSRGAVPVGHAQGAPKVELGALSASKPEPAEEERNLFRFRQKPLPPPPPLPVRAPVAPSAPAGGVSSPAEPSRPPITLKFIGIVEAPERGPKIAVLSDGRNVWYGKEGEIVLGQYRILRIGAESIDLAYTDGRGRQSIRLTGS